MTLALASQNPTSNPTDAGHPVNRKRKANRASVEQSNKRRKERVSSLCIFRLVLNSQNDKGFERCLLEVLSEDEFEYLAPFLGDEDLRSMSATCSELEQFGLCKLLRTFKKPSNEPLIGNRVYKTLEYGPSAAAPSSQLLLLPLYLRRMQFRVELHYLDIQFSEHSANREMKALTHYLRVNQEKTLTISLCMPPGLDPSVFGAFVSALGPARTSNVFLSSFPFDSNHNIDLWPFDGTMDLQIAEHVDQTTHLAIRTAAVFSPGKSDRKSVV